MMITDAVDRVKTELGRRKRGRPTKPHLTKPKPPVVVNQEEDEDVCFICFDGGSLVLCDHRGCPKAYHPACIRRDQEFFESAAKWNCGWHICSICQKTAHHMCYTCTYSLCKSCIKKADYVCVRDKGFCTICMKTIMLIENNGQGEDGKVQADFDDKLSWEYLFKVYWIYLKGKLSLTLNELTEAKNPWKEATTIPSIDVQNATNVSCCTTSATFVNDLEESNEFKRRKIDEHVTIKLETVNTDKIEKTEWASKELLDFVAHMKNGNTAVLTRVDVQALMVEYINKNNLRDPKNKNKILCDTRFRILFGKPQVGHIQMLKLLENHFAVKEKLKKRQVNRKAVPVNRTSVQIDPDWDTDNKFRACKNKKRKKRCKVEECEVHNDNNLDEFAAVDVYNMNLIYLRRDLMENLLEDKDSFHVKVVGSVVRIRISGCDLKHDMYRLVQVVGMSKVDVPYKVNSKLTDYMLEVLNLDKKETISIDAISDQEFSEEECRRLQRSIRCGLVKHFTVGEIQEKAVALQSVKLNDWIEKEILRLTHLRDTASEKGHKKIYRECVEKINLLNTPDERRRRLNKIPQIHSDPKMNPDYESDDTEEYFNKEHGDQMESKYYGKTLRRSRKDETPVNQTVNQTVTKPPTVENEPTLHLENVKSASTLEKSQHEVETVSTITKLDHQTTISSSVSNTAPVTPPSVPNMWHYRDPQGKVQGPFSLVLLQRWNASGYFPEDMKIWAIYENQSLLLTDVLKQNLQNYGNQTIPSSTVDTAPYVPNAVNLEKLSDSQSFGQSWSANNNDDNNNNLNYNPPSFESTVHLDTSNMVSDTHGTVKIEADVKHALTPPVVTDLPGPTPNPLSWGSASSLVVDGPTLPVSNNELVGCNSNLVKREWDSGIVLEVAGDHVATPTSNIDQNIDQNVNTQNPAHQPTCNDFGTWHDVGEMIEFSALAEESVSDLLAEVDAMESQYGGLPSPTSRRNSFVDDLFNDSFNEFSPTPDQGTRSDGFSSSGDIQLACQSATTNEHNIAFDFMKTSTSNGLQHLVIGPEIDGQRAPQGMIDINTSAKVEGDDVGIQTKTGDEHMKEMQAPKPIGIGAKLVTRVAQIKWLEGTTNHRRPGGDSEFTPPPQPPPSLPPLTLGLDPYDPCDLWDPNQYGGETYNSTDSPQERSRSSWNKYPSLGGSGGAGVGGYLRLSPVKGQRVCRFYESGRCKKGAACKHLHPSP
ncbi:zinc finger CCCH domain-containing protein 44-like [Bidens hawaiensis]|uniref:zinc finger CCCH domain-containing protein 44-like n=1 Tax=Bidens hawaiensis TaxID=980011 RepID=UPI00404A5DB8